MRALIHVVVIASALLVISQEVPGIVIASAYTAVMVALIWGLFGLTVRPLLTLLTLPINILTLGLFSFIINALLFWFISTFVSGFSVAGFIPAFVGSALLTLVSWALHQFNKD